MTPASHLPLNARPEPPFARKPDFGSAVRDTFKPLTWSKPANAVGYRGQLARDEAFTDVISTTDSDAQLRAP